MNNLNSSGTNEKSPLETAIKKQLVLDITPEDNALYTRIITRLDEEREFKAFKPQLWMGILNLLGSVAILAAAVIFSASSFAQTGLTKYLSLIFSDFGQVLANWQDFSYSILENLPLGSMAVFFGGLVVSAWLMDYGTSKIRAFRKINHGHSIA